MPPSVQLGISFEYPEKTARNKQTAKMGKREPLKTARERIKQAFESKADIVGGELKD
jgi:hypothetical protein